MKRFIISKCGNCGKWHIVRTIFLIDLLTLDIVPASIEIIATYDTFWNDLIPDVKQAVIIAEYDKEMTNGKY